MTGFGSIVCLDSRICTWQCPALRWPEVQCQQSLRKYKSTNGQKCSASKVYASTKVQMASSAVPAKFTQVQKYKWPEQCQQSYASAKVQNGQSSAEKFTQVQNCTGPDQCHCKCKSEKWPEQCQQSLRKWYIAHGRISAIESAKAQNGRNNASICKYGRNVTGFGQSSASKVYACTKVHKARAVPAKFTQVQKYTRPEHCQIVQRPEQYQQRPEQCQQSLRKCKSAKCKIAGTVPPKVTFSKMAGTVPRSKMVGTVPSKFTFCKMAGTVPRSKMAGTVPSKFTRIQNGRDSVVKVLSEHMNVRWNRPCYQSSCEQAGHKNFSEHIWAEQ